MAFKSEVVRYGSSKEFSGFAVWPERTPGPIPGVIVIQEAWGVDAHIEDVTRRVAAAGYVALAPDLFAANGVRAEPFTKDRLAELQAFINSCPPTIWMDQLARDAELAKRPDAEANRIRETMAVLFSSAMNLPKYIPNVVAAAEHLRKDFAPSKGQKVASMGFCMGGGTSALLAANDPALAGAAIFYGSSPAAELVPKIQCPVIGFYGGLDARINGGIPAFAEAMKANGKRFESHIYPDVQHAFFNDNRPSYSVSATRDSFARLLRFLGEALA